MVPTFLVRLANFPGRAFGAMRRLRIRPDEAEASPPAFWYQGKRRELVTPTIRTSRLTRLTDCVTSACIGDTLRERGWGGG